MAKTEEEKKAAQAAAHKKWRESAKGKAYYANRRKGGIQEGQSVRPEVQEAGQAVGEEAEASK